MNSHVIKSTICFSIVLTALLSMGFDTNKSARSVNSYVKPSDSVLRILNDYLPTLEKYASQDTIFQPFGAINEFDTIQHLAIGRFIDRKKPYAVCLTTMDSSIAFYEFEDRQWTQIGKEKWKYDNVNQLRFEDMDGDGRNEIVTETHFNMNGNTGISMYYVSKQKANVHAAGFMFGRYEVFPNQKIHYVYEGSWYANYTQTLYEWREEKLIPVREVTLSLKKADMKHNSQWITYSENPTPDKDTLAVKFKKTYREKKHFELVDKFFNEIPPQK